jgi:glycosyltransferase involved in cell wall biosynthesis
MNLFKISIITITYNDLLGLKNTIKSIDKYFYKREVLIDHVIIDGNSIDGTQEYITDLIRSRGINTSFISEPDLGIYDAMNKGVSHSDADYVIFINSGDILLSGFFERAVHNKLCSILNQGDYAGLALNCVYDFGWKKVLVKARRVNFWIPRMPSIHQGIIYKRLLLLEVPYSLAYKICGDFENICRLIKKYKFGILNINIAQLTAGGVSTLKPFTLARESFSVFNHHFSPNIFRKILFLTKILLSLMMVQLMFVFSRNKN